MDADRLMEFKNEWLADLIEREREQIVHEWMEFIRDEGGPRFAAWTDEELRQRLEPTVDQVIHALRTGDFAGAEDYVRSLVADRVREGFLLQEIEQSLFGLQVLALRKVDEATTDMEERFRALRAAGHLHGIAGMRVAETYQDLRLEQQARFQALYELSTALGKTLDPNTVMDTAVRKVADATRASSAAIVLAQEDGRPAEALSSYRMSPKLASCLPDICRSFGCSIERVEAVGIREAARGVPDVGASESLEQWADLLISEGCRSIACVPLLAAGRMLGSLVVCIPEPHDYPPFEKDFLIALAGHTATAMQNARLFEEAKGRRELSLLLEAARLFTSSLNLDEVLSQVARLAAERVGADYSAVLLPDEARERLHIKTHHARVGKARAVLDGVLGVIEPGGVEVGTRGTGKAFATGEPLLINNYAEFPDRVPQVSDITGPHSMLIVPMRVKDTTIGVFLLGTLRIDAFTEDDISTAVGVADQAAIAIENARLYEREKNIAETFQRSFLPASLPAIEGYELAVSYQAALKEAEVGGDFYDVFGVDSDQTAILIADVSGKGLTAAMYTAAAKYMIRAYAAENWSPSWSLEKFNQAFCKYVAAGAFITAFYAVLDVKEQVLTYASAGHNQPMLHSKRLDHLTLLDVTGPGLGVIPEAKYGERRISLERGDTLLIYTDGAINVRRDGELLAAEGLERMFRANLDAPVEKAVNAVFQGVLDYSKGRLEDDVILMLLRKRSG